MRTPLHNDEGRSPVPEPRECICLGFYCPVHGAVVALATFKTKHEAIEWAKKNGHKPLVARVQHLNDKKKPDYWREA